MVAAEPLGAFNRDPNDLVLTVGGKLVVNHGMQRSRAWCGTPPILGVVNMVGTRNFTCYKGAL